jgi:hypothetical protein
MRALINRPVSFPPLPAAEGTTTSHHYYWSVRSLRTVVPSVGGETFQVLAATSSRRNGSV